MGQRGRERLEQIKRLTEVTGKKGRRKEGNQLVFTSGVIKQVHDYRTCSRTSPLQLQSAETP
jgi:hypothetical protein